MSDARKYIQSRGLYIVEKKDLDRARQVAVRGTVPKSGDPFFAMMKC